MGNAHFEVATWNVERLTDLKIQQLLRIMFDRHIGILCMQEVRRPNSDCFEDDGGYFIIQSGSSDSAREWAGVGFIIAPWLRSSVVGYLQYSNRLCTVKLKHPPKAA